MRENKDRQLGNYNIVQLLGQGGFADVYLGEHLYLHTKAAIKVIHAPLQTDERDLFRNEALLIAHLTHPNIIRVLDFGVEDGEPFLVMEYASGGTLRQRAPRGSRLAPMVFMPYVQQVAAALQYAHEQKIIHRDIKPENMLLGTDELIKLSDFGIAQIAQSTLSQQTERNAIGTMMYMAPEQLQGRARPASDQYALAVVVYEWLTGVRPFQGSYMEVIAQHLSAPPPVIDEQALSIPHAVSQVIFKALSKDPHERFPRVQDFSDALERAFRMREPIVVQQPQTREVYQQEEVRPNVAATIPANGKVEPEAPVLPVNPPVLSAVQQARKQIAPGSRVVARRVAGCARSFALVLVILSLLLCALAFGGYTYFTNRNPPSQAQTLAQSFMHLLAQQNYDQAYSDLGSSVTAGTSHDAFVQQAQGEDQCDGLVTKYQQIGTSTPQGNQVYDYLIQRAKLAKTYHLHVTVSKDWLGNWQITDYNSDADVKQTACRGTK